MKLDPARDLLTHRAPPGLLESALAEAELAEDSARAPRSARPPILLLAASLLIGVAAGLGLSPAVAPQVAEVLEPSAPMDSRSAVRLVFYAPEAIHVSVAGSFNQWSPDDSPMRRAGDGLFVADLSLERGRHEYMFVVDGEWITDPTAALTSEDEFGLRNAVLEL